MIRENEYGPLEKEGWESFPVVNGEPQRERDKEQKVY